MNMFVRLSGELPSVQKSFFRNMIAFIIALAMLLRSKAPSGADKKNIRYLIARSVCGTIGILCNFYAVDHMVLSDASMLNKMSPFFAIVFSFILLKERLTLWQGVIVAVSFIGSLFIVKPSAEIFSSPAAVVGLFGGICAGAAYTYVRILGQKGVNKTFIVLFFSGFSCFVTLPYIIMNFEPMTLKQTLFLLGAGLSAAGGQFSITAAYCYAPAKEISVYDYSQLIFAMLLGYIFFGQLPDFLSIIGYITITASAVAMYLYNKKRA